MEPFYSKKDVMFFRMHGVLSLRYPVAARRTKAAQSAATYCGLTACCPLKLAVYQAIHNFFLFDTDGYFFRSPRSLIAALDQ